MLVFFCFLFNSYLAAPRPTLGHYRGDSLTNPMIITAFLHVRSEGHREPRSEVGSLSSAERLVGFEPGTTSSPAHLFAIRERRKRGPGTLQTRDQNFPK